MAKKPELVHDPINCKLGRRKPRMNPLRNPRTLKLLDYLPPALPAAPPAVNYSSKVKSWGMMLNDRYGDCTCAGWGHLLLLRTTLEGKPDVLTDADVLKLYETITGLEGAAFDPTTGANDNGCVETDVLDYLRGQKEIGAYAAFDASNQAQTMFAIDAFEGVYMGVQLPLSAQSQAVWDVADPSLQGDSAAGSWGGHCMVAVDYDPTGVTLVTWGALKKATWNWWRTYVKATQGGEAYAIISTDQLNGDKELPSGFDVDQLEADLAALTP